MIIPIFPPGVNIAYYNSFYSAKNGFGKLITKIINEEKISGEAKPITIHKASLYAALVSYTYLLWWYVNMSGSGEDIDYWKEKMNYEEVKKCAKKFDIVLDDLVDSIFLVTPVAGDTVVIGNPISSGFPGPYPSDQVAGAKGVAVGQQYELSVDNIYGKKQGDTTIRRS